MRLVLAVVVLATFVVACTSSVSVDGQVVGIVTEVTGDLSSIDSFVVLDAEGNSRKFSPADGMTVAGGPPSHLRDHVLSGEPVEVVYHEGPDGELIADDVVDA